MIDDEEFFAWLDGELDGEATRLVAERVAASPELSARADQHRRLAGNLRRAFDPVVTGTDTPPQFASANIVDLGSRAALDGRNRGWIGIPQWAAMAATLALGVFVGTLVRTEGANSPIAIDNGQLIAAATLDDALDTRLAGSPAFDGVRIGLTFRDSSGRICRSFIDSGASGLACREGEAWRIHGLFPGPEGQQASYRMAAGENPRIAAMIDETISGEPFNAVEEKASMERRWR